MRNKCKHHFDSTESKPLPKCVHCGEYLSTVRAQQFFELEAENTALKAKVKQLKEKHRQAMHEQALSWNATATDWANRAEAAEATIQRMRELQRYSQMGRALIKDPNGNAILFSDLDRAINA